jgi:hypothetical protein
MTAQLPRELTAEGSRIFDDAGALLALVMPDTTGPACAIAAEMVKRWNAYAALVDALRDARAVLAGDGMSAATGFLDEIDEALKLAGEDRLDPPGCVSA